MARDIRYRYLGPVGVYARGANYSLSDNFSSNEFDCKDPNDPDNHVTFIANDLVAVLQYLRSTINRPIQILSGYRTLKWNREVGGSEASFHTTGLAADIVVPSLTWEETKVHIDRLPRQLQAVGGIGYYPTRHFFHVDVRPKLDGKLITWQA